jgi:hypothetical protein
MTNASGIGAVSGASTPLVVALPHGDAALWGTPLDVAELNRLVTACRSAASNSTARGNSLENLMCWLFPHIPGVVAQRKNVFSLDGSQEVDVVFTYDPSFGANLGFGQYFIGECKNWSRPVGSAAVAWMDWKMHLGGIGEGILLAADGVTQRYERRFDASAIISKAIGMTPRRRILVVTLDQVASLTSTEALRQLLVERMLDLVSGRPLPV